MASSHRPGYCTLKCLSITMVLSFPKYFPVLRYLIPTLIYKCDNGLVSASHDLPLTVPTHDVYCIVIEHH